MGRPSILIVTIDCLRYDAVTWSTAPNILKVGSEGAYLRWAFSTSSWTLPSLNGFMTATHPLRGGGDVTLWGRVTLAETLSGAGYFTAGITKHPYLSSRYGFGKGFRIYDDRLDSGGGRATSDRTPLHTVIKKVLVSSKRLFPLYVRRYVRSLRRRILSRYRFYAPAPEVNDALVKALREAGDRPFFAWVHYLDTHFPYLPEGWDREELAELNVRRQLWWWGVEEVDPDALRRLKEAYLAKVKEVDEAVATLLDQLTRESGGLAVIITADHGEEFNEHGMFHHGGNNVWATLTHVPLAAAGPAADALKPLQNEFLDHTAITALLTRVAGATLPKSWQPTKAGTALSEDAEPAVKGEIPTRLNVGRRSVALGRNGWRYLRKTLPNGDAVEGLYRLADDPLELRNLAGSDEEEAAMILKELREILEHLT